MSEFTERFKRPGLVAIALAGGIALGGCGASSEAAPEETPTVTEQKVTTVDTFEVDSETTVTFFSSGSAEIITRN